MPDGKLIQPMFYLGSDLEQARRREDRLKELWQHIERTSPLVGQALWNGLTLSIGMEIAKGSYRVVVERGHNSAEAYARYVHRLQSGFPMVQFVPDEPESYTHGAENALAIAEDQIKELKRKHSWNGNIPPEARGMLHEALDAYVIQVKRIAVEPGTDRLTDYGAARVANATRLKERHEDVPLSSLGSFDAVQGMIDFWRNRPLVKNSDPPRPITKKTAEHHIAELLRFFRWLNHTDSFNWKKPEDFDEIQTRVSVTVQERQARYTPTQVDTYSIEQLSLLNKYATPLERVLLLLGLNCGFGAAEQGRLTLGQLYLHQHPHADVIHRVYGLEFGPHESFILLARPKTGVYGEWYLWPQTVEVLKWARQRRERQGNAGAKSPLLLTERGTPFFHQTSGGNRGQSFNRRWSDLVRRVGNDNHPDFPMLSFGKLRKTAGNLVRQVANGEIAGVFLCHGQPVKTDDLLDLYTNRPFGKVFEALKELQRILEPVFNATPKDLFAQPVQQYTGLSKIERIFVLHEEGKSVREIAAEVGLSPSDILGLDDDVADDAAALPRPDVRHGGSPGVGDRIV